MKNNFSIEILITLLFTLTVTFNLYSQKNKISKDKIRIGVNYGFAKVFKALNKEEDYSYSNNYIKFQIDYLFKETNIFKLEFKIEPSFYNSKYTLLNENYILEESSSEYLKLREEYTKERFFKEYALNLGITIRYEIVSFADLYFMGSIGPMISGINTERLKKGFAFSDIIGFGILFKIKNIYIDSRITFRHNSNAGLSRPNSGHNSGGLEFGISYQL